MTQYNTAVPVHRPDALTIACISDTHELHRELDLPDADVFLHAGDYTMMSRSLAAIQDFNDWLGELPHRYRVIIPGNHEFYLEADPNRRSLITNATTLIGESAEVMGLKIWGSPVTPLYGGAFGLSSPADRARLYATIPEDTDVLVTHIPPYGILDRAPDSIHHSGCHELFTALKRLPRLKIHLFGHVHGAQGVLERDGIVFVNAAMLSQHGDLAGSPVLLSLPRLRR